MPSPAIQLLSSLVLGRHTVLAFLEALQQVTLSDIQAKPTVTVMNHRQAEIQVGQRTPIRVIDAGSAGQVGATPRANVQFKESGIILRVTPHITSNRQIRMTVHAEQSRRNVVGGDLGFFYDKSRADNQLPVAYRATAAEHRPMINGKKLEALGMKVPPALAGCNCVVQ